MNAVVAAFAAGLMAKPMMVTLPLVLLVLDYWPLRSFPGRGAARLFAEKSPLLALAAIHAAATLAIQGSCGAMLTLAELGPAARAAPAPLNYARYLAKAIWPAGLSPLYLHPGEAPLGAALGAATALAAVTGLAWRLRRRKPALLAGWLWFLAILFPVIGLLQAGGQPNADRFAYMALVGLFVAAAYALPAPRTRRAGRAAAAAVAALVALLAVLTNLQSRLWKDSPTLLGHVLRLEPGHAEARHMLAASHFDRMEHEEAVRQLLILVATRPEWAIPRANLSLALQARGGHDLDDRRVLGAGDRAEPCERHRDGGVGR